MTVFSHTDPPIQNETLYTAFSYIVKKVLYTTQSKYQKISVYDTEGLGTVLVLDDVTQVAQADEYVYHEMLAHVPLGYHRNPETVLVLGGGDGGTVREVEKHGSVQRIVLCEIDGEVIRVSKKFFPEWSPKAFSDPRLSVTIQPAETYIRTLADESVDVVICDSTEYNPNEPISELLFGEPFYRDVKRVLKNGGVYATLGLDLTPGTQRINNFNRRSVGTVQKRIRTVFGNVFTHFFPAHSYGWTFMGMFVAMKDPNAALPSFSVVQDRFHVRNIPTRYYSPFIHAASCVDPGKSLKSLY